MLESSQEITFRQKEYSYNPGQQISLLSQRVKNAIVNKLQGMMNISVMLLSSVKNFPIILMC